MRILNKPRYDPDDRAVPDRAEWHIYKKVERLVFGWKCGRSPEKEEVRAIFEEY